LPSGYCRSDLTSEKLNDMPALASALNWAVIVGYFERNPVEVERLASDLIELSTRHHFAYWLAIGTIYRGWARSTPVTSLQASRRSRTE
jgi:hypothetical protein